MDISGGLLSCPLRHLDSINTERIVYLQLLRTHGLQPSLLRTLELYREVKSEVWIQNARDELARGEPAEAVLRKFRDNFIMHSPDINLWLRRSACLAIKLISEGRSRKATFLAFEKTQKIKEIKCP